MPADAWIPINTICKRFEISRSTFYRLLRDEQNGLSKLCVRIPPPTGRLRVPLAGFTQWLRSQNG